MPFGQPPAIRPDHQGHMHKPWRGQPQGAVQQKLARGRRQQVVAPQHFRDAHARVIDDDPEHVTGPLAVTRQHKITIPRRHIGRDLTAKAVGKTNRLIRCPETPGGQASRRQRGGSLVKRREPPAARPRITRPDLPRMRGALRGFHIRARADAGIDQPLRQQPVPCRRIMRDRLRLDIRRIRPPDIRSLIPVQPQPAQIHQHLVRRTGLDLRVVQILHAQHHRSAP